MLRCSRNPDFNTRWVVKRKKKCNTPATQAQQHREFDSQCSLFAHRES